MRDWRTDPGPFVLLTRHFFGRMFRNDTVDFEDQMKEKLIVVLSLLAVFFGWASALLLFKYHFVPDIDRSWQEKNYIFTLMMLVFGLVTLLEWDVLFPDRRDFLNLAPLPVRWRTVFAAKLASFVLFIGLFSTAMMSLSAGLFSMYLTQWRTDTIGLALRYVAAHLAAGFAACFAVFFAVVTLQLLLAAALPGALLRRVSTALRFVLAAGLVFFLLSFVLAPSTLGREFQDLGLSRSGAMRSCFDTRPCGSSASMRSSWAPGTPFSRPRRGPRGWAWSSASSPSWERRRRATGATSSERSKRTGPGWLGPAGAKPGSASWARPC